MHDVEVVEQLRRERSELVGHVVDARHARPAGVDHERPDAGGGLLRRMTGHGDGDGRAVGTRVVQRARRALPHCRSPLQGDQAIGVTGGSVVDVVVVDVVREVGARASLVAGAGGAATPAPGSRAARGARSRRPAGRGHGGGQGGEEQRDRTSSSPGQRCTCLSGDAVTVLPGRDTLAGTEELRLTDAEEHAGPGAARRVGRGGVRAPTVERRGPPAGGVRPVGAAGPAPRRSEGVHRGLGSRRRRRGARWGTGSTTPAAGAGGRGRWAPDVPVSVGAVLHRRRGRPPHPAVHPGGRPGRPGPGHSPRPWRRRGPWARSNGAHVADRLARTFPPYAPGGTSHRPTGASPGR